MRALIVARVSKLKGDQASRVERDDEVAREWAESNGHEVVALAADRNVSGGKSPWKRPELGPWLTDPSKVSQYDGIVVNAMDRLGRNAIDIAKVKEWAVEHGKRIVILSQNLQWPTANPVDGFVWNILAAVAEMELAMITKRYADAREVVVENGGFYGRVPWGFEPVGDKYHKTLQPVPELVPTIKEMIRRALHGDSLQSIADWLDESDAPKPSQNGKRWYPKSVGDILRSTSLKGKRTTTEGKTVHHHEGIIPAGEWEQLQRVLDNPNRRGPTNLDGVLLSPSTVRCAVCDGPMYRTVSTNKGHVTHYYRCRVKQCRNGVNQNTLDAWVDEWFAGDAFGRTQVMELQTIAGDGTEEEIAEVEAEIRAMDIDDHGSPEHLALLAERKRLQGLPSAPTEVREVATGQLVRDVWSSLDAVARRRYLQAAGVRVMVRPIDKSHEVSNFGNGRHVVSLEGDPAQISGTLQGIAA